MKIKKGKIEPVINLLADIPLSRKASRMRTKFIGILDEPLINFKIDLENIKKEYIVLDDNGQPVVEERNGDLYYQYRNHRLMEEDIIQLAEELYTIEVNDNNREILNSVKYTLEDYDKEFVQGEADVYNLLCDLLDELEDVK